MTPIFQPDGTMVPVSVVAVEPNTVTLAADPRARRLHRRAGRHRHRQAPHQAAPRPAQGPAAGPRRARVPRRRRLRVRGRPDAATWTSSRTASRSTSPACPRARASRAPSSDITTGAARRPTAPTRIGHPGSIGGGTTPGKVFKGTGMAGRMGHDRVTVKKATILKVDAERDLLLIKGPVPGRAQRARHGQEGLAMPVTTTLFTKAGDGGRHRRAARGAVRGAREHGGAAPGRRRAAGRPPHRHGRHHARAARSAAAAASRTARRAPAAPARARAAPRTTRAAAWSSGPTRARYDQRLPKRMKRLALQGALTSKFGDGAIKVVADLDIDAIKTRELVGYLAALGRQRPRARGRGRQGRAPRALGPQPARASTSSAPTRSTSSTSSTRTSWSSRSRRSARWRRCTHDAPGIAGHPAPGHQREVDGRRRSAQVHVRGP